MPGVIKRKWHVSFKLIGDQLNQLQCQLLRAFSRNTDCLDELQPGIHFSMSDMFVVVLIGVKPFPSLWNDVIVSDECWLTVFGRRKEYVRRPKGTIFHDKYTTKTMKFGGGSMMVWVAINEDGTKILIKCPDWLQQWLHGCLE